MKAVVIHAALLVAALGVAYQTWTRDEADRPPPGSVQLWTAERDAIVSIVYEDSTSRAVLEHRRDEAGAYLWATISSWAPAVGGEAADLEAAGEQDAPAPDTPTPDPLGDLAGVATIPTRFVVGQRGDEVVQWVTAPRAVREVGTVGPDREAEFGLAGAPGRIVVDLGRETRELLVGGLVFGTGQRYVRDPATDRVYVVAGGAIGALATAAAALPERRLHLFQPTDVAEVRISTDRGERTMLRSAPPGSAGEAWTSPDAPEQPDQTFANFIHRVRSFWLSEFAPDRDPASMVRVLRVDYHDSNGHPLGHLELYRAGGDDDEGEVEYFVRTEHTRVLANISRSVAEPVAQDAAELF